jgi:hypothetical protein
MSEIEIFRQQSSLGYQNLLKRTTRPSRRDTLRTLESIPFDNDSMLLKHGHPGHLERSSTNRTARNVGIQCERACAAICV